MYRYTPRRASKLPADESRRTRGRCNRYWASGRVQGSDTKAAHEVLVLTVPFRETEPLADPWIAHLKTKSEREERKKKGGVRPTAWSPIPASWTARADWLKWEPKSPLAWGSYTPRPQLTFFPMPGSLALSCHCARAGTYLALPPGLNVRTCLFKVLTCTEPLFPLPPTLFLPAFVLS